MSSGQVKEKLTMGYKLPDHDVVVSKNMIQVVNKNLMRAANRSAECAAKGDHLSEKVSFKEAISYYDALLVILLELPEERYKGICEEYLTMLYGKRPKSRPKHL
ncbi:hypothetical protein [Desulforamulus aeronauticus]|uniref:Uncharacterized protein n=1 Tax=Desulforamulus aeronauticus DSM 10349 TaxID=1121421 RepID=A0A1M6WEG6_9FIRM|nr:hypothetical protein [Desulforamulus aeronauticus]SHK92068.1 hypothetical protein SAMN02745123_03587 [Desulforamulus aeronauticus DSM 10349]